MEHETTSKIRDKVGEFFVLYFSAPSQNKYYSQGDLINPGSE
jgi:hypothetical protein